MRTREELEVQAENRRASRAGELRCTLCPDTFEFSSALGLALHKWNRHNIAFVWGE